MKTGVELSAFTRQGEVPVALCWQAEAIVPCCLAGATQLLCDFLPSPVRRDMEPPSMLCLSTQSLRLTQAATLCWPLSHPAVLLMVPVGLASGPEGGVPVRGTCGEQQGQGDAPRGQGCRAWSSFEKQVTCGLGSFQTAKVLSGRTVENDLRVDVKGTFTVGFLFLWLRWSPQPPLVILWVRDGPRGQPVSVVSESPAGTPMGWKLSPAGASVSPTPGVS